MNNIPLEDRSRGTPRAVKRLAQTLALALVSLICVLQLAGASRAAEDATVSIEPSTQQVGPGQAITTELRIEDVTDLFGYEFQVTFDSAVVNAEKVVPGDFLDSGGFEIGPTIDNSALTGTVDYAYTQLGGTAKSGSGVLAVIRWQSVTTGTSPIQIQDLGLSAPGPKEIPATTEDGEIVVKGHTPSFTVYLPLVIKAH